MEGLSPYDSKKAVGVLSQYTLNAMSQFLILAPTWLPLDNLQPLAEECSYVPSTDRGVQVAGHGTLSYRTRGDLGIPIVGSHQSVGGSAWCTWLQPA